MALEESGIKFVTEGEAEFNAALEDANKVLGELGDTSESTASMMEDASGSFDAVGEIITGAFRKIGEVAIDSLLSAGSAFVDFAAQSFQGALDAEKTMARLNAQIQAQGKSAAITADQAQVLADEYKHLAGGSDDAIIAAEAVLLKFNQISGDTFPNAIQASADLAALMGVDVATAAQQLGFALETGGDGLQRIAKQTGAFTDEELKSIQAMQKSGDIAGAQKAILDNLNEAIGGTAETLANTTAGQWAIFQETISDTGESIAANLLPILLDLGQFVFPLITQAATDFGDMVGGAIQEATPFVNDLETAFTNASNTILDLLPQAQETVTKAFDDLVVKAQPVITAVGNVQTAFDNSMPQIQGAVEQALGFIQNLWDTVFPSIQSTTDNTLNQIMTLVSNILNAIAEFWTEHGTTILAIATLAIESIFAIIGGTLALISGIISATLSIINGDWDAAWKALKEGTSTFLNSILSIVGTNLEDFLETWRGVGVKLLIIVSSTFNTVVEKVKKGMDDAISAAQAIVSGFHDIGKAIIDGMIQGVVDTAVGLANAVYNAVNDAISGGQSAADSHSPSQKTRKLIGQPLGQGMELGIEDTTRDVEQALALSVQSAMNAITPSMNAMQSMFGSIAPPASAGQIAAQSVYNSSLSNTLTINANYPMQSARSVADDLRMWTMLTGNSAA